MMIITTMMIVMITIVIIVIMIIMMTLSHDWKIKSWQIYLPSLIQVGRTVCQEAIQNERVRYLISLQANAMISLLFVFFSLILCSNLFLYVTLIFKPIGLHESPSTGESVQKRSERGGEMSTTLNNVAIVIVIDVIIPLNTVIIVIVHDVIFTLLLGNVTVIISLISVIFAQILWPRPFWSRFVIKILSPNVETLRLRSVHQLRSAKRSGSLWL